MLDDPENEAGGDGQMAHDTIMDVEKIVELVRKAQLFDKGTSSDDDDEAKA